MRRFFICLLLIVSCVGAAVTVTEGQRIVLPLKTAAARVINLDKTIVAVNAIGSVYYVTGLRPGETYVYVWDINDVQTAYKVVVRLDPARTVVNNSNASQSFGRYELYVKTDSKNKTPVNKKMFSSRVQYETVVAGVKVATDVKYKYSGKLEDTTSSQLENFNVSVSRYHDQLVLGDSVVSYTELTSQYAGLQGVAGAWQVLNNLSLAGFSGKRAGGYWGDFARDDAAIDEYALSGARAVWQAFDSWRFGVTSVRRQGTDNKLLMQDTAVSAIDAAWRADRYQTEVEFAKNTLHESTHGAARAQVAYDNVDYGWRVAYRDIDPAFLNISDYMWYRGAKGFMLSGRLKPNAYLGFAGNYERYLQRYDERSFGVLNEDYYTERSRFRLNVDKIKLFRPSLTAYANRGYNQVGSGFSLLLDQCQIIPDRLMAYVEYAPWRYRYDQTEYQNVRTMTGLQQIVFTWWRVRLEHVSDIERQLGGGYSNNPHGYNFVSTFGAFTVPRTNIHTSLSYWHQNRKNSQGTIDRNRNAVKLSVNEMIGSSLYWYVNGVYARENALRYEYVERIGYFYNDEIVQSEISGGLSYSF